MIEKQLKVLGIHDPETLAAMQKVPRHEFVPPDKQKYAYKDGAIAIGYGQTISQPYIVAFMTKELRLKKYHKVLEIGTGSGYQAAILSELVNVVYSIEIIPELAIAVKARFKRMGYDNIHVKLADGYYGWEDKGPFDAIIITAAVQYIPLPLIQQLKEGGRMLVPVGKAFFVQHLVCLVKKKHKISSSILLPVRFVPFTRAK